MLPLCPGHRASCSRATQLRSVYSRFSIAPPINYCGKMTSSSATSLSHRRIDPMRATEEQASETEPLMGTSSSPSRASSATSGNHAAATSHVVDWAATGPCFLFPALGGLLFGYDIGATSGVLVSLTSPELSGTDWYGLTPFQSGLVVSMSLLGALLGSLMALAAGNRLGRRTELLMASGLYGVSAGFMGVAGSLNPLLLGRILYGLGMGFAMHAAPAYIAETSPPSVRGLLISLKEAAIVGGILLGYLSSYLFIGHEGGWRDMYSFAAPLAIILGVGMATLPESPRWLLLAGCAREDAVRALVRAEGKRADSRAVVEAEIDAMELSIAEAKQAGSSNPLAIVKESRFSKPLLVGMSLMLFQQITGQPSVLYYASKIFQDAGFAAGSEATGVSVLLGTFKLLMTLVAVFTVDSWGRRPLLLYGVSGMVLSLLALGFTQAGPAGGALDGAAAWASVGALLLYVGCYQMSFGPISWLIVGEVFPLAVRGQAIALATFVNFGSNFLVSLVLPEVQEAVGLSATYLSFAVVGMVAVTSIYLTVPETKGKTLEEIEELWQTKSLPK